MALCQALLIQGMKNGKPQGRARGGELSLHRQRGGGGGPQRAAEPCRPQKAGCPQHEVLRECAGPVPGRPRQNRSRGCPPGSVSELWGCSRDPACRVRGRGAWPQPSSTHSSGGACGVCLCTHVQRGASQDLSQRSTRGRVPWQPEWAGHGHGGALWTSWGTGGGAFGPSGRGRLVGCHRAWSGVQGPPEGARAATCLGGPWGQQGPVPRHPAQAQHPWRGLSAGALPFLFS